MADRKYDHTPRTTDTPATVDEPFDWDYSGFGKVGPSRANGSDPRDDQGHEVDYAGQDCPTCREHLRRELEQ